MRRPERRVAQPRPDEADQPRPTNRTFADLAWYSIDKRDGAVAITVSKATGAPPVTIEMGWTDAVRFARDILGVACDGEPETDRP